MKNFSAKRILIPCILIIIIVTLFTLNSIKNKPVTRTGFFFNTVISITVYGPGKEAVLDEAYALCNTYESMLSRTIEHSDIWKINHSNGTPVTVHTETANLVKTALYYCEKTNGAIDITLAPLSDLWDFSSDKPKKIPSKEAIQTCLKNVDYHAISVSGNSVTLSNPDAAIDLGFIAKGYIADELKAFLEEKGIQKGIINLGGNVMTLGNKPDGSSYHIGIQKPFDVRNASITQVPVSDSSVVSSGIYERYFEENGKLYHHILNPKTGYPYENNLLGVTILSKSSTEGDALSTTCFVLGLEDGMKLINSLPEAEAVFITSDYELHYSESFPVTE